MLAVIFAISLNKQSDLSFDDLILEGFAHHLLALFPERGGVLGIERISAQTFGPWVKDDIIRYDVANVAVLAILTPDLLSTGN
jgi:hypothetical protein